MQQIIKYILPLLRYALLPFAILYGIIVWVRNAMYNAGLMQSLPFSVPIISVGNLNVGGTGKTPHINYLIELLKPQYFVATLSRGYKRYTKGFIVANENANARLIGDEPMQFYLQHAPHLTVSVAEDRLMAIPQLMQQKPYTQVILLDDAFQHRSVKPNLQILITDANNLYMHDYILPFGRLREFKSEAKRADIIIVSKCSNNIDSNQAQKIISDIKPLPHQKVFFSKIVYGNPYSLLNNSHFEIANKKIILVTGIANNVPLISYLESLNSTVHTLSFPDHYYYTQSDINDFEETFKNLQHTNKIILTTQKDATRLLLHKDLLIQKNINIAVLPITIEFLFDKTNEFNNIIESLMHTAYPPIEYEQIIKNEEEENNTSQA